MRISDWSSDVCSSDLPARALGLRPGQTMTAAQALSKGFATAEYDAAQIEHWQQFLAAWAYRFSSQVSVHYPRTVVFEIESSLGLFGPWPVFEKRLRAELTQLGFRHRIVADPNPVAARVLANAYDALDRKTGVEGTGGAVSVDPGGSGTIK